ncbi:MAG: hypothetical protein ACO2O4_02985 [Minisyncoccia bacterium]|jgi:hypothetical protein
MNITKLTNEDIKKMDLFEVFQVLDELKGRAIPDPEDVGAGKVIAELMFQKSLLHLLERRFHYLMENSYISDSDTTYYILRYLGVEGSIFFNNQKVFISDINIERVFQNYENLSKLLKIFDYNISFYPNYPYSDEILLLDNSFYENYKIFKKYIPSVEIKNKVIMEKVIIYFILQKISNNPDVFVSLDENIAFVKLYGIYKYKSKSNLQFIAKLFKYKIITKDSIITENEIIHIYSDYLKYLNS